ncbi:MAG: glycosyltransferase involved in cell wall biosynthesis [Rubritalea sp.]|jgi:glycosyltransferase involved in cell wall biosynthesis
MNIAILHTRLAPYYVACLRELAAQGHSLLVFARPQDPNAPFDRSQFEGIGEVRDRNGLSESEILSAVESFSPDATLVAGWTDKGYMKVCRKLRKLAIPVIAGCDTQWKGSMRQYLASWTAPLHIHQSIDVLWVSGERQRFFAQALGYTGNRYWDGFYACDWPAFAEVKARRSSLPEGSNRAFLYVGRYVDVKGIDILAEAYRLYCNEVEQPWTLLCAGAGPLVQDLLDAGSEDCGFTQPKDLPKLMERASAFVLPSRFEPWGVVVQEAAASGLPILCSEEVGAGVHLVRDFYNGRVFESASVDALVDSMLWMHNLGSKELSVLGNRSFELSKQYTPNRWVDVLINGVKLLHRRNLSNS